MVVTDLLIDYGTEPHVMIDLRFVVQFRFAVPILLCESALSYLSTSCRRLGIAWCSGTNYGFSL